MACIVKGICCSAKANGDRTCTCSIRTVAYRNDFFT